MIRKVLSFQVKEVRPRVLQFTGSTEDEDRRGDVITASGWRLKDYKKNPVFLWAHQYDTPPVGKAVNVWIDNDRLKFHIQFAERDEYEFADTIYKLYKGGYLRATSVGFMPIETEPLEIKDDEDGGCCSHQATRYLKQDLLELSACPVPANPNALAEAMTKGLVTDEVIQEIAAAEVADLTEEPSGEIEEEHRSAISYESAHPGGTPKAGEDEEWDAGKEVASAEVDDMKIMCAIIQGDPDIKGSYKLPHHKAKGHTVVWQGVAAAGAVLMGARGGIDATEAEKNGAKAHLGKHYEEFERKPPWKEEAVGQAMIADELDYLITMTKMEGLNKDNMELGWDFVEEVLRLSGSDIPVDIAEKIGTLLNTSAALEPESIVEEDVRAIIEETVANVVAQARGIIRRR